MGTPVKQSVRLMIRALQMFAKKKKKILPSKHGKKDIRDAIDTAYNPLTAKSYKNMTKHEKTFDTKWRMGNAEIRLRELLGHNYRN